MIQAGSHTLVFITVLLSFIILESSYQVNAGERSLVLQLTKANFTKVSKFKENVVLVIFFDSGHAHHKGLQSICEDVARVLEGVVPAAAVAIAHTDLLAWDFNKEYKIKKLPVLIFLIPGRPYVSYEGPMKAISIIEFAIQQVRSLLKERIRRKSVIEFHSFQSFDELVLKSKELWIIYFYYPRNKYKSLELMLWKMVVSDLKDKKLMLGFVECHSNTFCTDRFNIEASTVMAFGADKNRPIAYEGAKNASAIIWFSLKQVEATMPLLEVRELTQNDADRMALGSVPVPEAAAAAFTQRVEDNHPSKLQNADVNVPARAHKAHCSRKRSQAASKVIEEYLMPFVEKEKFGMSRRCKLSKNDGNCLADACDILHCHLVMNLRFRQRGCNPKAAAENRQLCESLADNCFPANEGSSARRLHDLFLRQFCDAHTCSGGPKPLSIRGKKRTSSKSLVMIFLLILSALIVCLVLTWQLRVTRHDQRKAELCRISLSKCTA